MATVYLNGTPIAKITFKMKSRKSFHRCLCFGGSKEDARDAPSPSAISFIFMQFSGKIWPNNRLVPQP